MYRDAREERKHDGLANTNSDYVHVYGKGIRRKNYGAGTNWVV